MIFNGYVVSKLRTAKEKLKKGIDIVENKNIKKGYQVVPFEKLNIALIYTLAICPRMAGLDAPVTDGILLVRPPNVL